MDSCGLKEEKAKAIAGFCFLNKIPKMVQFAEVLLAVVMISWWSTRLPSVLRVSGEFLLAFSSYLLNPHVVFIVGNALVVACYVLSRHTGGGDDSEGSGIFELSSMNHHKTTAKDDSNEPTLNLPANVSADTKETPEFDKTTTNNALNPPAEVSAERKEAPENEILLENGIVDKEQAVVAGTVVKKAAQEIERFQRTQSEKLKREISMKPRRELRRSVTERRSSMVVSSGESGSRITSFETVETLSNEEFRLAVEAFISKQQSFLKSQSIAENCH